MKQNFGKIERVTVRIQQFANRIIRLIGISRLTVNESPRWEPTRQPVPRACSACGSQSQVRTANVKPYFLSWGKAVSSQSGFPGSAAAYDVDCCPAGSACNTIGASV